MSVPQPPGRRPPGSGPARRPRPDETLPGVQLRIVEDLTRITADDEFLDAIAAGGADLSSVFGPPRTGPFLAADGTTGGPVGARRPVGLGPLLVAWRSELVESPLPPLPTLAPRPMLAPADRSRRRSMRSLISVGAAIAVLLMASTAVGARSAQPGQPLWGLTQVLWSSHANSIEAKVKVQDAIGVARKALDDGNVAEARRVLLTVSSEVSKVDNADGRADLEADLSKLNTDIQKKSGNGGGSDLPPPGNVAGGGSSGGPSSVGGVAVPPVTTTSGRARATVPPVLPPGATTSSSNGGGIVAQGPETSAPGTPPQSETSFPGVPGGSVGSSLPPVMPGDPVTSQPVTAVDPADTVVPTPSPAGTTPADPTTAGASVTDPVSTSDPAAPATTPPSSTDPGTTDAPATSAPSTDPVPSSTDPTTSTEVTTTQDSTTQAPTTDTSTTDIPTTESPTSASTTSEMPTTLDTTTPSTDANGSTIGDPSGTTTQTGPVNPSDTTSTSDDADGTDNTDNTDNADGSNSTDSSDAVGVGSDSARSTHAAGHAATTHPVRPRP